MEARSKFFLVSFKSASLNESAKRKHEAESVKQLRHLRRTHDHPTSPFWWGCLISTWLNFHVKRHESVTMHLDSYQYKVK
jgi:hypothetical protein